MSKRIIANWKMNFGNQEGLRFLKSILLDLLNPPSEIVICPPALLLREAYGLLPSHILLGAQDVSGEIKGPFTGSIAAHMLKEAGCSYVIVGHCESRKSFGYTNDDVAAKAQRALEAGMTPIICVGEDLRERRCGEATSYVINQTLACTKDMAGFILAYEPLWAINTGHTATLEDIIQMKTALQAAIRSPFPFIYGGSVSASNVAGILEHVDGVLVGGACLEASSFISLVRASCK